MDLDIGSLGYASCFCYFKCVGNVCDVCKHCCRGTLANGAALICLFGQNTFCLLPLHTPTCIHAHLELMFLQLGAGTSPAKDMSKGGGGRYKWILSPLGALPT